MTHANFLKAPFDAAITLPSEAYAGPKRFFNREMSWLAFNWRVLEEAVNPRVPLLERLRFLSISATNLDEFFTVRVAGLQELAEAGNTTPAADGMTPAQQLVLINADARDLLQEQQRVWNTLHVALAAKNIILHTAKTLSDADKEFAQTFFMTQVFPVLSPLAIDPAHPFPFIANEGFSLALKLERISDKRPLQALLPIPHQIARFVALPSERRHPALLTA